MSCDTNMDENFSDADERGFVFIRVHPRSSASDLQNSAANLNHLFQPFHRASNVGTIAGTGVGLTITKESVELQGGVLSVTSEVGVGTPFTVRIPLVGKRE